MLRFRDFQFFTALLPPTFVLSNLNNDNTVIMALKSSTEDIEQKTQLFQSKDRDKVTKKRDQVQTKKFVIFAKANCGLKEDDLELGNLGYMKKWNKIHPDYLMDKYLSRWGLDRRSIPKW